jgi:hypothetical protein
LATFFQEHIIQQYHIDNEHISCRHLFEQK